MDYYYYITALPFIAKYVSLTETGQFHILSNLSKNGLRL